MTQVRELMTPMPKTVGFDISIEKSPDDDEGTFLSSSSCAQWRKARGGAQ